MKTKAESSIEEPSPGWKWMMEQKLREEYGKNDNAVFGTINKVWYHEMDDESRAEAKKKYGFTELADKLMKIASSIG